MVLVVSPTPTWVAPAANVLLSLCFIVFLLAPLIAFASRFVVNGALREESRILQENRSAAPPPVFARDPLVSLPAKLEAYYVDRFGFRSVLIHTYNTVLRRWLKASGSDLVLGKHSWIFYAREDVLEDFLGLRPFSEDELRRWKRYLEGRREAFARRNARYLFVIGPDKNTIYPEMLPGYISERRGHSRLQQLLEYLRKTGSPADVLDLHEALLAAKPTGTLYYQQDTHWNGRGFWVAYQAMCRALQRWFPEITPRDLGQNYKIRSQAWAAGDWALVGLSELNLTYPSEFLVPLGTQKARMSSPPAIPDGVTIREPWLTPLLWVGPGKRKALVIHDSYMRVATRKPDDFRTDVASAYVGYQPLAEHFARMLLVGARSSDREEQILEQAFMNQLHPDVVIEERAERTLRWVPAVAQ